MVQKSKIWSQNPQNCLTISKTNHFSTQSIQIIQNINKSDRSHRLVIKIRGQSEVEAHLTCPRRKNIFLFAHSQSSFPRESRFAVFWDNFMTNKNKKILFRFVEREEKSLRKVIFIAMRLWKWEIVGSGTRCCCWSFLWIFLNQIQSFDSLSSLELRISPVGLLSYANGDHWLLCSGIYGLSRSLFGFEVILILFWVIETKLKANFEGWSPKFDYDWAIILKLLKFCHFIQSEVD